MQTKQLFYESIELLEFEANVIECKPFENVFHVILDQTAFYPDSGGMLGDWGHLNDIKVLDTIKVNGEIVHVLEEELKAIKVKGIVDAHRRFTNIQTHDTQHLLTAILEKDYQLDTISHHNHGIYADLVLEGPNLDEKIIKEVEAYANDLIIKQTKLDLFYIDKKDLGKYNIEDNPKYSNPVRLTNIEGLDDYNACGCLHFHNLANLQAIKILGFEKQKKNYKVFFTSGLMLLEYFGTINDIFKELKILTKANEETLVDTIETLYEKNKNQAKELNDVKTKYYELLINELEQQPNNIKVYYQEDLTLDDIKIFGNVIANSNKDIIALLQVKNGDQYPFILVKPRNNDFDLKELFTQLKEKYNVQGGGAPHLLNGQSSIDLSEIINKD